MKNLMTTLALAACLAGARNASAAVETVKIKANNCYPTYGVPSYNQWGVYNSNPNDHTKLNCAVHLPANPYANIQMSVTGWALSNDINPLSCTVTTTNQDGNGQFSGTVTFPYAPNVSQTKSVTIGTASPNTFVAISCFIPRAVNAKSSYISTLTVQGFY